MSRDVLPDGGESATSGRRLPDALPLGRTLEFVFYAAILAVVAFMLVTGQSLRWEDRVFPFLVGVPTVLLCLLQLAFLVRPDLAERFSTDSATSSLQEKLSESIEGASEEGRPAAARRRVELQLLAWIGVLPVAVFYLGMVLVLPVWVFGFAWFFQGSARAAAVTTVVFSVLSYVIFVAFLDLRPWAGALFA
ncbi:tripartite tricarboxylate transporter TctB family protein [Halobacteriales archaeon Cl-PHB]